MLYKQVEMLNGLDIAKENPLFEIPTQADKDSAIINDLVKIGFITIDKSNAEYMWVRIKARDAENFYGFLIGYPTTPLEVTSNDLIVFKDTNILTILKHESIGC